MLGIVEGATDRATLGPLDRPPLGTAESDPVGNRVGAAVRDIGGGDGGPVGRAGPASGRGVGNRVATPGGRSRSSLPSAPRFRPAPPSAAACAPAPAARLARIKRIILAIRACAVLLPPSVSTLRFANMEYKVRSRALFGFPPRATVTGLELEVATAEKKRRLLASRFWAGAGSPTESMPVY